MNTNQPGANIEFDVAKPEERQAALELLVSARLGVVDAMDRWWDQLKSAAEHGLIVARQSDELLGAIWAQPIMTNIVAIWQPISKLTKQSESQTVRGGLLKAMNDYLTDSDIELARALIGPDDEAFEVQLESLGCTPIAMIESMFWPVGQVATAGNDQEDSLAMLPSRFEDLSRLERVMNATYQDSLDCKDIRSVIGAERVLQSYASAPNANAGLWYVVELEGEDVGCLILADDDEDEQCEIMYLGIVPRHRGKGLGLRLVQHAQQFAADHDRRRVTVAADRANVPALRIYEEAGFIAFAEQRLVGRIFER
jgi:GNAT superfamily N-acetyltransferase